jgi:sigma-B regulation protein RsbU (phosphoserine phosphatase)
LQRLADALLKSQAQTAELARAHQQIDADARKVGELQRSLLPQPLPCIPGLDVAASYQPCGQAGGDLYDIFPLDDELPRPAQRWCILIADASGHGLAAAMVTAMVQAILHAHPPDASGPAELLAHANRQLCRKGISGFVTAFLGVYEPRTRRLTYARAGHAPPLVKTYVDGSVYRLDSVASIPLGIDESERFEEGATYFLPGDTVLFYTDGITEARDRRNELFSEDRLERAFGEYTEHWEGPARLIQQLEKLIDAYRAGRAPTDDQTLLALSGIEQ